MAAPKGVQPTVPPPPAEPELSWDEVETIAREAQRTFRAIAKIHDAAVSAKVAYDGVRKLEAQAAALTAQLPEIAAGVEAARSEAVATKAAIQAEVAALEEQRRVSRAAMDATVAAWQDKIAAAEKAAQAADEERGRRVRAIEQESAARQRQVDAVHQARMAEYAGDEAGARQAVEAIRAELQALRARFGAPV